MRVDGDEQQVELILHWRHYTIEEQEEVEAVSAPVKRSNMRKNKQMQNL